MIIEHSPGKTIDISGRDQHRQALQKINPIVIGSEYLPPFDSPDDHMVQRPWCIDSRFAWHDLWLSDEFGYVKYKIMDVPLMHDLPTRWSELRFYMGLALLNPLNLPTANQSTLPADWLQVMRMTPDHQRPVWTKRIRDEAKWSRELVAIGSHEHGRDQGAMVDCRWSLLVR